MMISLRELLLSRFNLARDFHRSRFAAARREEKKKLKIEFENFLVRPLSHRMSFHSPHLRHREEAEKGETDEMIVNSSVYQNRKCSREEKVRQWWGWWRKKPKSGMKDHEAGTE
jgi:hypothetical protein